MGNNLQSLVDQMHQKLNDLPIDEKLEGLRQQMILIGYLDKLSETNRTTSEINNIVTKIAVKNNWREDCYEAKNLLWCYYNGAQDYDELLMRYQNKIIDYNPRSDIEGYRLILSLPGLDDDIKKLVENYPDFEYVMKLYNNEQEQSKLK